MTDEQPKKFRKKRLIISIVGIFFVLILCSFGFVLYRSFVFSQTVFKSDGLKNDVLSFLPIINNSYTSDIDKSISQKKDVNILLLGYGGAGHDGAYLTDSMMLVNFNTSLKQITFISIPRDMWVPIPSNANYSPLGKINSAYAIGMDDVNYQNRADKYKGKYGGGNMSKDVVSQVLGIPVDYFMGMDFNAFKSIVDDLGGVNVNVANTFDDYAYPSSDENANGPVCSAPMNTATTCRYYDVHFDAGPQIMNGTVALEYARSRHAEGIEGSDFARAQRQQKLLVAMKDKALQLNELPNIFSLMDSIQNNILTDLTLPDIKDLVSNVKGWNLNNIDHEALTADNALMATYSSDGQYILVPRKNPNDFSSVHTYIQQVLQKAALVHEAGNAKIEILNGTTNQLIAGNLQTNLNNLGIQTVSPQFDKATLSAPTLIYDFSNNAYPDVLKAIVSQTGGQVITQNQIPNPDNASIVILLGSDYLYRPGQ